MAQKIVGGNAKQETADAYTSMSRWYDIFLFSEKRIGKKAIHILNAVPGENILEIGYGTGYNMSLMAGRTGDKGRIYGIDISDGMYRKTIKRLKRKKILNAEVICGNALNLPYADQSFDAVFMSFTLELFSDDEINVLMNECRRVLKETGRICVVSLAKSGKENLMVRFYERLHHVFPKYIDCRPVDLEDLLKQNGFITFESYPVKIMGLLIKIKTASLRF